MAVDHVGTIAPEEESGNHSWIMNVGNTGEIWGQYFDVNGNALESNKVQAARAEELEAARSRCHRPDWH